MPPTISRAYHAHAGNYTPGGNKRRYICVHYTSNNAPAINEAKYAQNNRHDSSYHFVLDGGGVIYQILDTTDTAWSVGAWKGAVQYIGNNETVNIEVCNTGGPFSEAQISELSWLVRKLMDELDISANHIVRHWDCHSGRKMCPYYYAGSDNPEWEALKERITGGDDMDYKIEGPDTVYIGQKVEYNVVPDLTYNHAWALGSGWDYWGSDIKDGGSAVPESETFWTPDREGTYRLWANVYNADGTQTQTPDKSVKVISGTPPVEPTPIPPDTVIDYDLLAEIMVEKIIARLKD